MDRGSVVALGIGASTVGPSLAATTAATPQPESAPTTSHTVERGSQVAPVPSVTVDRDTTVWKLAEVHLDDGSRWPELVGLNRGTALSDGTTLAQGTQTIPAGSPLRLPASAHVDASPVSQHNQKDQKDRSESTYTVKANDTLSQIAETKLDDGSAAGYMKLFKVSAGTLQPGGEHLIDPTTSRSAGRSPSLVRAPHTTTETEAVTTVTEAARGTPASRRPRLPTSPPRTRASKATRVSRGIRDSRTARPTPPRSRTPAPRRLVTRASTRSATRRATRACSTPPGYGPA